MTGLAMGEVPGPVFPALHPERRRHDAVQHLPEGRWLVVIIVVDWIVHKSPVTNVYEASIDNRLELCGSRCGEGACSRWVAKLPQKMGLLRSPTGASSLATKGSLPQGKGVSCRNP